MFTSSLTLTLLTQRAAIIHSSNCPGRAGRCDPKPAPSAGSRGERRYGDDMLISQAGDGLRDVREDWPAFRMTGRCQMPSGNESAGQMMCLSGHDRLTIRRRSVWVARCPCLR
jgi:hypothetical protein